MLRYEIIDADILSINYPLSKIFAAGICYALDL